MEKKEHQQNMIFNLVSHKIRHSDVFLSLLSKLEDIGDIKVFDKLKH